MTAFEGPSVREAQVSIFALKKPSSISSCCHRLRIGLTIYLHQLLIIYFLLLLFIIIKGLVKFEGLGNLVLLLLIGLGFADVIAEPGREPLLAHSCTMSVVLGFSSSLIVEVIHDGPGRVDLWKENKVSTAESPSNWRVTAENGKACNFRWVQPGWDRQNAGGRYQKNIEIGRAAHRLVSYGLRADTRRAQLHAVLTIHEAPP